MAGRERTADAAVGVGEGRRQLDPAQDAFAQLYAD
jgi:hypothetical protein